MQEFMLTCMNCGNTRNAQTALVCNVCNEPLTKREPTGAEMRERHSTNRHISMRPTEMDSVQNFQAPTEGMEVLASAGSDRCQNCNYPLRMGSMMCPNCLTSIAPQASPTSDDHPKIYLISQDGQSPDITIDTNAYSLHRRLIDKKDDTIRYTNHATVLFEDGTWHIRNTDKNYILFTSVNQPLELKDDMIIQIGQKHRYKVKIDTEI